jgi:MFS family permease
MAQVKIYTPRNIQTIYFTLLLCNTLAASFIWGINTIFLLNAGLTNAEAFGANAFFTLGQVLFEIPTGIVADTLGRRISYLLGAFTLMVSTALYLMLWYMHAPFWPWALSSMLLGLGFTFFSGAVEAWLVDALHFTNYKGNLDTVFARGQIVSGIAMLTGSVAGGFIAQTTNLGVPYILRSVILGFTFILAFFIMKDLGFTPKRTKDPIKDIRATLTNSIDHGLRNKYVKWIMLAAPFTFGVSFYVFYAMQPYLLDLYGDPKAYGIAGIVAAVVAGSQIAGGIASPYIRKLFTRRTNALICGVIISTIVLFLVSIANSFIAVVLLVVIWGLISAAILPIRSSYLNSLIPSQQRATVLSFDSLMGSSGGIVIQPILGKTADIWNYPISFMLSALFQGLALPFLLKARTEQAPTDFIGKNPAK